MIKRVVTPFGGYPIAKIETGLFIKEKEYNFLKSLKIDKLTTNNLPLGNKLKISKNKNILKLQHLKRLKNGIWKNFKDYVDNILEIENVFSFCQSWCTIQTKDSHHPAHAHPNNIFSCVYYAKTSGTHLQFSLYKSKLQDSFFLDYPIKRYNLFNSKFFTLSLKAGDMVFFPGDLSHQSLTNEEDERIIIGASFFIDGKLGSDETTNAIDTVNKKNVGYN